MTKPAPIKKTFLSLSAVSVLIFAALQDCNNAPKKAENAQNNPADTIRNADTNAYLKDIDTFRKQSNDTIAANNKIIAEFKEKMEHEKKHLQADYKKRIAELEQKNRELKKKIDEYKAEGQEKWKVFKADFSRDMDTVGKQIKRLASSRKG
jgi:chromosome segregation ATPase